MAHSQPSSCCIIAHPLIVKCGTNATAGLEKHAEHGEIERLDVIYGELRSQIRGSRTSRGCLQREGKANLAASAQSSLESANDQKAQLGRVSCREGIVMGADRDATSCLQQVGSEQKGVYIRAGGGICLAKAGEKVEDGRQEFRGRRWGRQRCDGSVHDHLCFHVHRRLHCALPISTDSDSERAR